MFLELVDLKLFPELAGGRLEDFEGLFSRNDLDAFLKTHSIQRNRTHLRWTVAVMIACVVIIIGLLIGWEFSWKPQ